MRLLVMDRLITWITTTVSTVLGWCTGVGTDPVKHSEWYLDLSTKCVKRIRSGISDPTKVKLYHRQCEYLAEKLETAIKNSRLSLDRSLSPEHKAECLDTLKLVYRLAMEVESFIQDCSDKAAWMQAALTTASVPARVSSWGCHLTLCTALLLDSNKLGAAWLTFTQLEGVREAELLAVKAMASDDEDALMRLLESLSGLSSDSESNVLERDIELVAILWKRLTAMPAMSTRAALPFWNLKAWQVEPELLYQPGKYVGVGSSGTVYKAVWFGGMDIALKTYNFLNSAFNKEVAIIARLSHPNIVSFLGYITDSGFGFIVLELMDEDLRTLMEQRMQEDSTRKAPFSIWVACDIMLQVAEAVQYMHHNGVVHRDLKSENILVRSSKDGDAERVCAKVCDFGSSKRNEVSRTYSNQTNFVGESRWRAPELFSISGNDEGEVSTSEGVLKHPFKSDAYSFGMLCYEILTGNVPFSDIGSFKDVQKEVLKGVRPQLPRQCPQSVKNLIKLCWDPQPIARPTFTEICEELWYIRCSLLLEPLDQGSTRQPALPVPETLDLQGEVSRFKGQYSSLKVVMKLGTGGSDIVTVYKSSWNDRPGISDYGAQVDVAQKRFIGSCNKCFVNEVSIMAELEHPNVVRLLHYATDRRSCSIVMELMDEDLDVLMCQRRLEGKGTPIGPFSIDEAVHVVLQIAQGMEYVHGKNVAHRDLKSRNILVRRAVKGGQLEVKVADFGLSKKLATRSTPLEREDSGVGTIRWMSPEVTSLHSVSSKYDPFKSDVFSFGMVCYEILVGRAPFYEIENLDEVSKKILAGGRPTLPGWTLSSDLRDLIESCWQEDPRKRPSFAHIVKNLTQSRVSPN